MTGEWIKVQGENHTCILPTYEDGVNPTKGDQWQCECGAVYEVTGVYPFGEDNGELEVGEYPRIDWWRVTV